VPKQLQYAIVIGVLLTSNLYVHQSLAQQCWVYQKSNTNNLLRGIFFSDSLTGTAVGEYGITLRTTDGGASWGYQSGGLPSSYLYGVSFNGTNNGLAVGYTSEGNNAYGLIRRTTNGGRTWIGQSTPRPLYAVSMTDSNVGVTVGTWGTVLWITDGGSTWTNRLGGSNRTFLGVSCIDPRTATIVGENGIIFRTTDAGITWQQQLNIPNITLLSVSFADANHGTVVGQSGIVLRTTNGGTTWTQQTLPTFWLWAVSFADTNVGIIVGENSIYRTTNGGETWEGETIPGQGLYGVALPTPDVNASVLVGAVGAILHKSNNCSPYPEVIPISPPDGAEHQALPPVGPPSLTLTWNCLPSIQVVSSQVQVASDSNFLNTVIVDTIVALNRSFVNRSLTLTNMSFGTKYFWRVRVQFLDSTATDWSKTWSFTTAKGVISGVVFEDINRDSIRNPGEVGLEGKRIDLTGSASATVYSDVNGMYSFWGLDSGQYNISEQLSATWVATTPQTGSYTVELGVNDTSSGNLFGSYFPWNSVGGVVFEDKNDNGMQDDLEQGLVNWAVQLQGTGSSSIITDSLGHFAFPRLVLGSYTIYTSAQPPWEQVYPQLQNGHGLYFTDYDQHYQNKNFAVHKVPTRVKITLNIADTSPLGQRDIWFGVHPGTTFGIWGVDPACTNYDFSEGEFDLPPQLYGLFDARFVTPKPNNQQFGYGTWTDMRPFLSATQVDTYKVSFRPSYAYGGDYPFTLSWSPAQIASSYSGSVTMVDQFGETTDMRSIDYRIVSNENINSVRIIANAPIIAESYIKRWKLISLPYEVSDGRIDVLFHSAGSNAFSFNTSTGYQSNTELITGVGYWLKYAPGFDSLPTSGVSRTEDIINVDEGWNMIGALSVPLDVEAIGTFPLGIIEGRFFTYENGRYAEVETLKPGFGYWIKSRQAGQLTLSSASSAAKKHNTSNIKAEDFSEMRFQDANGNEGVVYFGSTAKENIGIQNEYYLPPLPPEAPMESGFDVRYASGRMLELVEQEKSKEVRIQFTSEAYPITLQWKQKSTSGVEASLRIDNTDVSLAGTDGSIILNNPTSIVLEMSGIREVPKEFALFQNYPNPFNPTTVIKYQLPVVSMVMLRVYNLLGQTVATLVDEVQEAGYKSVELDARSLSSGIYFYQIDAHPVSTADHVTSFSQVKKMILIK